MFLLRLPLLQTHKIPIQQLEGFVPSAWQSFWAEKNDAVIFTWEKQISKIERQSEGAYIRL